MRKKVKKDNPLLKEESERKKEAPHQQDNDSFQLNEEQKVQLYEMLNTMVTKMRHVSRNY